MSYAGKRGRLAAQGYASYAAYLRSDAWAATKARYRASRMPQTCRICDSTPVDLHHRSYRRLGAEYLRDLVPLCRAHHNDLHKLLARIPRDQWYRQGTLFVRKRRRQTERRKVAMK